MRSPMGLPCPFLPAHLAPRAVACEHTTLMASLVATHEEVGFFVIAEIDEGERTVSLAQMRGCGGLAHRLLVAGPLRTPDLHR